MVNSKIFLLTRSQTAETLQHQFVKILAIILQLHCYSGKVQKFDARLPAANEYLLLSGNARDGTVDIDVDSPGELTRYSYPNKI